MSRRVAFGLLLLLAALLPVRAEASRTSVWESNPPASLAAPRADAAGLLASLAPAAAADIEAEEPPRFDLGDVILAERELEREEHFDLGPLTLVDLNLLRGPPSSYPETRVGGFELLPPFRVGASPTLNLWSRQACGSIGCGLVSDSPEDPWGLEASVSQSGWFVVADPATGKIQKVAPGWARSNPAALKDVLLKEGGLSEAEAIALMTIGGVSQAPTYAPCAPGQDCIGPGQGVRSPGADVALQVAAQPVCSANGLSNAVDSVMGQGGPIPCPIGPPRTEAGEAANQAMAMYGAVAIAGGRGSGGVAAGAPDVSFVVDEAGMTVRAEGVVTGPHRGRGKGSRPDPPGGLTPGEHRGHLIPEGGVDNPSLVNVPQNIISETPRSNLGPKKSFDNLASRIAAQNPRASVRVVAEPLRRAGEARPYAVTYWVERDGVRVHGVTIFNK